MSPLKLPVLFLRIHVLLTWMTPFQARFFLHVTRSKISEISLVGPNSSKIKVNSSKIKVNSSKIKVSIEIIQVKSRLIQVKLRLVLKWRPEWDKKTNLTRTLIHSASHVCNQA